MTNCSVCSKPTHLDDFVEVDGWPVCVGCVDKANDAKCRGCDNCTCKLDVDDWVDEEIITICPGCGGRMGERDDMTYYSGRNWCLDCAKDFIGKGCRGRDKCDHCASCSVNTG